MQRGEVRNPVTVLILCLCTCGIYNLYWIYTILGEINGGLGREEFSPTKDLVLGLVTCGLYMLYVLWRVCEAVVELQKQWGVEPEMESTILFVLNFVYVGPMFIQKSLNNAWESGTPGGAGGYGGAAM